MHAPTVTEDLFTPAALEDPYPVYDRLRAAGAVHHLPEQDLYLVVRHAEIRRALDDPATFSSNLVGVLQAGAAGVGFIDAGGAGAVDVLATADSPIHTGQRRIVQKPFSRPNIARLRDHIDALLAPRVGKLVADGGGDWMAAVATPLPMLMIGHILGLPAADADQLAAWSDAGVELLSGVAPAARLQELTGTIVEFAAYLHQRLHAARSAPAGGLIDVINVAVAAGELSDDEATTMMVQLVTAGTESTTSLIGSAARLLATDAALQQRLRRDRSLIDAFVEEVLRLESPFRSHFRVTTRAAELGGIDLRPGARLMLLWGAANRDRAAFDQPATLDVDRRTVKSHAGFGRGIHFCIGAHLARLEAGRALHTLIEAGDHIALAAGPPPRHVPSLFVRRLAELPLQLLHP